MNNTNLILKVLMILLFLSQQVKAQHQELDILDKNSLSQNLEINNIDWVSQKELQLLKKKWSVELHTISKKATQLEKELTNFKERRTTLFLKEIKPQELNVVNQKIYLIEKKVLQTLEQQKVTQEKIKNLKDGIISYEELNTLNQKLLRKKQISESTQLLAEKEIKELNVPERPEFKDKAFVETDVVLNKTDLSLSRLSPLFGYALSKKLNLGIGTSYQPHVVDATQQLKNSWSSRIMGRFKLNEQLYVQAENLQGIANGQLSNTLQASNANLLGFGLDLPQKDAYSQMRLSMFYNLNSTKERIQSAYGPLQIRFGYLF